MALSWSSYLHRAEEYSALTEFKHCRATWFKPDSAVKSEAVCVRYGDCVTLVYVLLEAHKQLGMLLFQWLTQQIGVSQAL